jgi:hypothetical protein
VMGAVSAPMSQPHDTFGKTFVPIPQPPSLLDTVADVW